MEDLWFGIGVVFFIILLRFRMFIHKDFKKLRNFKK